MAVSIKPRLAHTLGRRDESPNMALAHEIAHTDNTYAVNELITFLTNAKQPVRHDAMKVLYEIGAIKPVLIAPHLEVFLRYMFDKNNRIVWGCLTAINTISPQNPGAVYPHLNIILAAADAGSVIAKDQAINILCILAEHAPIADNATRLLLERIKDCAINQLPMYAEKAGACSLSNDMKTALTDVLRARLRDEMPPSKKRRIETVIKKLLR